VVHAVTVKGFLLIDNLFFEFAYYVQKSYFLQAGNRPSQRLIMLGYQRPYLKQVHALANLNWTQPGIN